MLEGVRAAKKVIVCAEEIVSEEVIASDPNRTVIPGFLVTAVVECPLGAHPSPVQGYYKRDDAFFQQYHAETKTQGDFNAWAQKWVNGVADRDGVCEAVGRCASGRAGREAACVCGEDGLWVLKIHRKGREGRKGFW